MKKVENIGQQEHSNSRGKRHVYRGSFMGGTGSPLMKLCPPWNSSKLFNMYTDTVLPPFFSEILIPSAPLSVKRYITVEVFIVICLPSFFKLLSV